MVFPIAKIKAHSLTGRITSALLWSAFKAVKRNRGAAGIDKVSISMFQANLAENLTALERDLKDGSFRPLPLRRKFILKEPGKFRPLGIPAVRDRVGQEVLRRLLHPIFESLFHDASHGFRPGRNCHQALDAALRNHHEGYNFVVDADMAPLLANIVLNHLDWQLQQRGIRFVRYADDFVLFCRNRADAEEALRFVTSVLSTLGLALSPVKTQITTYARGYSFLGFFLSRRSRRMRDKSRRKFKEKVRALPRRSHNCEAQVLVKLNRVIRGTAQYFATCWFTSRDVFHKLDSWIRMRLRCMKFKRLSFRDNPRLPDRYYERLGLLSLESFLYQKIGKA